MRTFSIKKRGYLSLVLSFAVLSILSVKLFIPDVNTNAATQTASQTAGPNTISMSNSDAVAINAIPTSEQTIFSGTNTLTVTNSCPNGATVTLTTNSNSDTAAANNLIRSGSDDLSKTIAPTTGSSLVNNSWGYSINGGTNYYAVPAKDETPAKIYDSSSATSSADTVSVKYGIKMDNNIPSGNYSNDVIYTVAVKPACLSYAVTWDLDGGTGATGATYPTELNWGQTVNLSTLSPTRDGYTFNGWSNGSDAFTGSETGADVNSGNSRSVTMTAQWTPVQTVWDFNYTGNQQTWSIPATGYYKLEVWGASGGTAANGMDGTYRGGYGGYSIGIVNLTKNDTLYIYVGGGGNDITAFDTITTIGNSSNGGGQASRQYYVCKTSGTGGGGATHIATKAGLLNSLSGSVGDILIVAGGGGGATVTYGNLTTSSCNGHSGRGGDGGGFQGVTGQASAVHSSSNSIGGSQTGPGSNSYALSDRIQIAAGFGQGCSAIADTTSVGGHMHISGGGGYYGGSCGHHGGGGGGSGYIGSSNLISGAGITKHMTCYSCTTSTAATTRTNSNTNVSATATSDYSKTGNGYVRITYLGTTI